MFADMTLREGFEAFHKKNRRVVSETESSNGSENFFNAHDIAHVVFGCDSSLRGEGLVKLWTIFGTTLGFTDHIGEYADANAFALFKKYRLSHVLLNVPQVMALTPLVMMRARSMKAKWPWDSYEQYLDTPIRDIRQEFNILPVE